MAQVSNMVLLFILQEGLHSLMNVPSSPPTPFADQAPLDQQLIELMNNSRNNSNEWDQQMLGEFIF